MATNHDPVDGVIDAVMNLIERYDRKARKNCAASITAGLTPQQRREVDQARIRHSERPRKGDLRGGGR